MGELADRRANTATQIAKLRNLLTTAATLVQGKACVFATGSYGRCEAGPHSDLDLFIVGKLKESAGPDDKSARLLNRLDEICVKADLIKMTRDLGIREFSGDGRYLVHYTVQEFTETLGKPEDDVTNTFTARVLLLLESHPLLEASVYAEITKQVIDAYWRDFEDRPNEFMPAFLANDILRLWRTFCVNYEARTEREPPVEKAKGKLKNYKLKHSRLLTCYSALLYLLAIYSEQKTVSPSDAIGMIEMTPTERLEWLLKRPELAGSHQAVRKLLNQYENFLETTNASEEELICRFSHKEESKSYLAKANSFGDLVFAALNSIGNGNRFHRILVV